MVIYRGNRLRSRRKIDPHRLSRSACVFVAASVTWLGWAATTLQGEGSASKESAVPFVRKAGYVQFFMQPEDVRDVRGKPRFIANRIHESETLKAPSQSPFTFAFPDPSGVFRVFTYTHQAQDGKWEIAQYATTDFSEYSRPRVVLRQQDDRRWLAMTSMTRRTDTGEFLLLRWARGSNGHAAYFFRSQDGVTWKPVNTDEPAYTDQDSNGIAWQPEQKRYVVLQTTYQPWKRLYPDNMGNSVRRVLTIRTSQDAYQWEPGNSVGIQGPYHPADRLIVPDLEDPPELEFYRMTVAFPYGGRYVGLMLNYASSPSTPGKHGPHLSTEWWVSPDGISHWSRPYREFEASPREVRDLHHAPVVFRNKLLWLFFGKIYELPIDRLAGVFSKANAAFSTNAFSVPARPLFLNAQAAWSHAPRVGTDMQEQAYIMAELLDERGRAIPGFEKEKSLLQDVDGVRLPLRWQGRDTVTLAGEKVVLRFYFRDATIHAVNTD